MTEALPVHHRVVIAIEATALAVPYLPVFKKLVVAQLLQHLKQASFEVWAQSHCSEPAVTVAAQPTGCG